MPTRSPTQDDRPGSGRRPRNYFSRREQYRLLFLVGLLMLAIYLMVLAADPQNWHWMWGGDAQAAGEMEREEAAQHDGKPINTRLQRTAESDTDLPPGAIEVPVFNWKPSGRVDNQKVAERRAEKDIWRKHFERLDGQQRLAIFQLLQNFRSSRPLDADARETWLGIVADLDQHWHSYTKRARQSVMDDFTLSEKDRSAWMLLLHELLNRWTDSLEPALRTAADSNSLDQSQRQTMQQFQALYDEIAMEDVRDDTFADRAKENNAWFRLVEALQNMSPKQLADPSTERVGFQQLFEQPEAYRGKLVTVRGKVGVAYRRDAPSNPVGVKTYYVFWIQPTSGAKDPIAIYALGVPPGFPPIGVQNTKLNEDVEFTGYFFKRMAYRAQKEPLRAPMLVAAAPRWTPKTSEPPPELPAWWLLLLVVVGLGIASGVFAVWVYQYSSQQAAVGPYGTPIRTRPEKLTTIHDDELAPSVGEALQQLADDEVRASRQQESD